MAGTPVNAKDTSLGHTLGQDASDKISLYGGTPVTQRASSVQAIALTTLASSADFAAGHATAFNNLSLVVQEMQATMTALKAWKGGA